MKTFKRLCIKTETFTDGDKQITLQRGKEYITGAECNGEVTVLTRYWFEAPANLFAGEEVFTDS